MVTSADTISSIDFLDKPNQRSDNFEGVKAAISTGEFVDSIGVATHWNYRDTPYFFAFDKVLQLLVDSGIRHVRDGFHDKIIKIGQCGIQSTLIADLSSCSNDGKSKVHQIKGLIKSINKEGNFIVAVEGPNEPDLFWKKYKKIYKGFGYIQGQNGFIMGAIAFQKDLYTEIKNDPVTFDLTVIGIALGKAYTPVGRSSNPIGFRELSDYVDWGNFHPYPGSNPFGLSFPYAGIENYYWHSNFPSIKLDEYPYAFKVYAPPYYPKPMAVTETGYSTYREGISETVHGKYIPRLFCEYFRLGIKRTFIYEFVDEYNDSNKSNKETNYGLVRRDLSPKPGCLALKSLISLLKDTVDGFKPSSLEYKLLITGVGAYNRTNYVHHILLQKSDGDFYFLFWHEVSSEDTSVVPHRQIIHSNMPAKLTFSQSIKQAMIYTYDNSWNLTPKDLPVIDNVIYFEVPDQVIVISLTPST